MPKHIRKQILLDTADLDVGDQSRILCPGCGGGSTQEKSLSVRVTEEGTTVYQCFRASCDVAGAAGGTGRPRTTASPKKVHKRWEGETTALPESIETEVFESWRLDIPEHWYWTEDMGGRIAMSIRSPQNTHRGWVLRVRPDNKWARTKAYTYFEQAGTPKASWYKTLPHANTVLVEDVPSALRAAPYMNAVALLGTNVSEEAAYEIAEHQTGRVIIALDADATTQAIRLAQEYRLIWRDVGVAILTKDLKDQTEEELWETINRMPS